MYDQRTAQVNVGCIGVFHVTAYAEGGWEMTLNDKNGRTHSLCMPELRDDKVSLMTGEFTAITVPVFVWDSLMDKVEELHMGLERGSIHTPHTVGTS